MRNLKAIGRRLRSLRSSALVIALLGITLVTVLTLTLFLISRYERKSANLALGKATSESLADLGADLAITRLKEATEDGLSAGKMWVSEPGRIRVFNRADLTKYTDYNLFSGLAGPDSVVRDLNNVDLNRRSIDGTFPIAPPAPGASQANMKVGWINLPANPGAPFSNSNPIAGRVGYWIDDESTKVNINTADGSKKRDLYRALPSTEISKSFGFGTPGEISLEALTDQGGQRLTETQAENISKYAWQTGFNASSEIGRVHNLPTDFYSTNKFNITHYSKTPELTFYGEPRIYLTPIIPLTGAFNYSKVRSLSTAGLANYNERPFDLPTDTLKLAVSSPIDFIYPISNPLVPNSNQFPSPIYQFPARAALGNNADTVKDTNNFGYVSRIANAISGKDSYGNAIQWPAFDGNISGFSDKYSPRQIDCITLQIHDISNTTVFADQYRGHSLPSIAFDGIVNTDTSKSRSVIGLGRYLKLTEIYIQALVTSGSIGGKTVSSLQMRTDLEYYFPENYAGMPLHSPYNGDVNATQGTNVTTQFSTNNTNGGALRVAGINQPDMQNISEDVYSGTAPLSPSELEASWLGSHWQDSILQILDQNNTHAGIDVSGNTRLFDDPDQDKAKAYHPFLVTSGSTYLGSVPQTSSIPRTWPLLEIFPPQIGYQAAYPGTYFSRPNRYKTGSFHPMKEGVSELRFRGGFNFWNRTGGNTGGWIHWEPVPLDSLKGPFSTPAQLPASVLSNMQEAVIPVDFDIPLASGAGAEYYQVRVADPLVNKFPGDWIRVIDPPMSEVTIALNSVGNTESWIYKKGGASSIDLQSFIPHPGGNPSTSSIQHHRLQNVDGDNPEFRANGGGDPLSVWLPRQDIRYPKQSRFPSVGALNYIRTGIIPDDLSVPLSQQKGTPWRSLNFSSSSSDSQEINGSRYPDWAMLDLFTVPYLPQLPYGVGNFSNPPIPSGLGITETPLRKLTYGGATEGKLNINNPEIPYPFNLTLPGVTQSPPKRTAPLEALFYGIRPSSYLNGDPLIETSPIVDAASLRSSVQNYLNSNGPFLLPGQLADVPAINAYTYNGVDVKARSRNDLMKQIVGATTTQSNVFSVIVVAQSIKKNPKNSDPAIFQEGDSILGETRRRYIIERHIDFGKDGVPGNANNPGADQIVGTADDPIDVNYHPKLSFPLPYKWRIVSVESLTN